MTSRKNDDGQSRRRRKAFRIATGIVGLVAIAAGSLLVMNLIAGKADGADSEGEPQEVAAEEESGREAADGEEGRAPVPVEVAEITAGTVSAYIASTANLVAEYEVEVLAEVEGRVATLGVEEGDRVRRGQQLAALVQDDAKIRLRKAELRVADARRAYDRSRDLVDKELVSREEFDKLEIEFELAEQELAEASWSLEKTIIRAPFDGLVTDRMIQAGQHVRPGDRLLRVTDFDPLIARIYLPERDILGLDEGRSVRIRLNADETVRFAGRIRQISPVVDTATGTVKVTIEASDPPSQVRPGSFVTVDIVRETHEAALLLPREAVLRELKQAHIFLAEGDQAVKQEVTLGLEEGDRVEALTGVEAGDKVIVAGQGGLKDGSPIRVLDGQQSAG